MNEKKNEIIKTQEQLIIVTENQAFNKKVQVGANIIQRHTDARKYLYDVKSSIKQQVDESNMLHNSTLKTNEEIDNLLENL